MGRMAFWPFGREPADVERASRVVTAPTRDSRRVRAKLTLHFEEPQTQAAADDAADRCAQLAEVLFGEVPDHEHLLGNEPSVAATLLQRLPPELPALRSLDVAALHVVGDPGSVRRRTTMPPPGSVTDFRIPHAGPPPSVPYPPSSVGGVGGVGGGYAPASGTYGPPSSAPASTRVPYGPPSISYPPPPSTAMPPSMPRNSPSSDPPPSGLIPPPSSVRAPFSTRRRSISSSLRAMTPSLIPPRGSSIAEVGASLAPLLRDAATRLLIGALRTHDLVMVRRVPLDSATADLLSALLPISEAPPGEFEASRIMEITRWRGTIGPDQMDALRAECAAIAAFLTGSALIQAGTPKTTARELVEALCQSAFGGGTDGHGWPDPAPAGFTLETVPAEAAQRIAFALDHPGVGQLEIALAPLLESVSSDVSLIAQMAKLSLDLTAT